MSENIKGSVGMNYKIYKMQFSTPVHFGNGKLTSTNYVVHADTMFSALCIEAVKCGKDVYLNELVEMVKCNQIRLSDALPFIEDTLYMPKPMLPVVKEEIGDSILKKAYKKLKYIPIEKLDTYLEGNLMPKEENEKFANLGNRKLVTKAALHQEQEADPYGVEVFQFKENCGLYLIIGYEEKEQLYKVEELLQSLSFRGIGGKVSAGYGKFELHFIPDKKIPEGLLERLNRKDRTWQIALSVSMAREEELEKTLCGAKYMLLKRSGFIQSETYAKNQVKKKDFFVFEPGSCFSNFFEGDVFDVSYHGEHAVYRYGKPMFIGVDSR